MATYSRTNEETIERGGDFKLLPSGKYIMRITKAEEVESKFQQNKDGTPKVQVMVRWELSKITPLQEQMIEDGLEDDEEISLDRSSVVQYFTSLYATITDRKTNTNAPTPWKEFLDTLAEQEIIGDELDLDELIGVEQLVTVNKAPKEAGENKGKMGNKVAKIGPIRQRRTHPAQPVEQLAAPKRPVTVPADDPDKIPF